MLKKIKWNDVRLILIFVLVCFLYSFASNKNQERRELEIRIDFIGEDNVYITNTELHSLVDEKLSFKNNLMKDYEVLNDIEIYLNKNAMIESAQVYKTVSGILVNEVKQRTPIGRVFDKGQVYYMDSNGKIMPRSKNHSARVPIVTGEINETTLKDVNLILSKIHQDEFLKKSIVGIDIFPYRNIILTDRNFNFKIVFGKAVDIDRKFNNYKAFIQHSLQDTIIKNYKEVNLNFIQQVVCTK